MSSKNIYNIKVLVNALLIIASVIIAYLQLRKMVAMTIDDAYITFAYSKNAALGYGFVFARGEFVEATSSFLWSLLLVPFEYFGVGSVLGSKILGSLFFFLSIALVFVATESQVKSATRDRWFILPGVCAVFLTSGTAALLAWTIMGLENSLVGFLMICSVYLFAREAQSKQGIWSFLPIALLETARPEGFTYCFMFLIFRSLWALFQPALRGRWILTWTVALFATLLTYETWGLWYYGHLLPNTVGAKVSSIDLERLKAGLEYVLTRGCFQSLCLFATLLALVLILCINSFGRRKEFHNFSLLFAFLLPATTVVATQFFFSVFTGGDWMPVGRFVSHLAPVLGSATVVAWVYIEEMLRGTNFIKKILGFLNRWSLAALSCLYVPCGIQVIELEMAQMAFIHLNSENAINPLVEYVNQSSTPDDILACSDVGRLGYYFKGKIFDWWGLASPEVVERGEALGKIRPETVLSKHPRFIVLYAGDEDITGPKGLTGFGGFSTSFMLNQEFLSNYHQVMVTKFSEGRYHVLFERLVKN